MLTLLKNIPNIGFYFLVWGIVTYFLKKYKHKMAPYFMIVGILLFLVCATNYVPKKLIQSIEKTYSPLLISQLSGEENYYILVLGSGAALDARLPASQNLGLVSLSRLVEGIRIFRMLEHGILVTSAATKSDFISQAEITKDAAISLGINAEQIEMLETPTTTLEEALAFKSKFGTFKNIILVTSALHMPRAVEIFKDQGLSVIAAPTEYLYKQDGNSYNGLSLPSVGSISLMNTYQLTTLKLWYYRLFHKNKTRVSSEANQK
jgi:uncharacterized SAM-binding protein YcdF (DUF218 family)